MTDFDFKITINGNDVSSYVLDRFNFITSANSTTSYGTLVIDSSCPFPITYGVDVDFYLNINDGSFLKIFSGFLKRRVYDRDNFRYTITANGHAKKTELTEYTGRFRQDLGNGNMKTIIQNIIDEKFPDWNYDDNSIPDTDITFLYKNYQDKKVNQIFNEFADSANRVWYVDENKTFFFIERSFTQVNSIIEKNINTVGVTLDDQDDTRLANVVKVIGARFNVTDKQSFVGSGGTDEFTLENFPNASTGVQYRNNTDQLRVVLEGVEDYDSGTDYDAYFKPDVPSLKFNINTVAGATLDVIYNFSSNIREEIPNAASVDLYGFEKVKRFDNDNISTPEEAFNIASNYAKAYSFLTQIYTVGVIPSSQTELEDWVIGNNVPFKIDGITSRYDIVQANISWGSNTGLSIRLNLNDVAKTNASMVSDLLARINQRSQTDLISGSSLVKTFYWGGNIFIDIENISMSEQSRLDGTFVMQDPEFPPDGQSLMGGTSIMRDNYTTQEQIVFSQCSNDHFRERLLDDFLIHPASTATIDLVNREVRF